MISAEKKPNSSAFYREKLQIDFVAQAFRAVFCFAYSNEQIKDNQARKCLPAKTTSTEHKSPATANRSLVCALRQLYLLFTPQTFKQIGFLGSS